ncbi:MAG: hypothetical protein IKW01_05340 [Firmicutes bacterium]|nr:hypothetical protein [Bacillota bacterium]
MTFMDLISTELDFQKYMLSQFSKMKRIKASGRLLMTRKKDGYKNFYIRQPGETREKYVRKSQMEKVTKLQIKAMADLGAARAEENIKLLQTLRDGFKPCDFFSLQEDLEEKFRLISVGASWNRIIAPILVPQSENPIHREHLMHTTTFGLIVRSKNEAHIAEKLFSAGLEFYYEKALHLFDENGRPVTFYPDFTILLPGGRTVFWEHKGLLESRSYRERDGRRTWIYHRNGIYQPYNLIVTCDGPKGEYPGLEIGIIVDRLLAAYCTDR